MSVSEKPRAFFFKPWGETCLLVLAESPSDALISWRMEEADHSIAVDGGFVPFRHAGLVPDTLIGDLDSLSNEEHCK